MEKGHSFNDIRGYTLGQISVFYKQAIALDFNERLRRIQDEWISNHASAKGIQGYLKDLKRQDRRSRKEVVDPKTAVSEARRLASVLGSMG